MPLRLENPRRRAAVAGRRAVLFWILPGPGLLAWVTLLLALAGAPARAAGAPYPGLLRLEVDATDLDHRIFQVQQRMPVAAGPLRLYFARWLPGHHAPNGDVGRLAGLQISTGGGQALAWVRDPLDTHAFTLTVPPGADELVLRFAHLSPVTGDSGRVVATRQMLNLQWNNLLLYPAGHDADAITVQASLRLPEGWLHGTALRGARGDKGQLQFQPVSLERLIDSPVFAGRHFKRFALEPEGAPRPVALNLMADSADALKASDEQIDAHRRLVQQADKLFGGARHFAHYELLLALSDELGGIGLEHHESSENVVDLKYFEAWDKAVAARELLPHEYAHSWNGKFRRPEGLATPHFNTPMQNTLLWLYEGQTEFWGKVLAARCGLVSPALARDSLADYAALMAQRSGRQWRNLQDTTHDAQMTRRGQHDWRDWQRSSGDYYVEGVLIWLEADMLIRERSAGQRSLDDFARAFFGIADGQRGPQPYRFDDIVATLNAVQAYDWAPFLRERLDGHGPGAPLDGLARAGWKLAWSETPSEDFKANEAHAKNSDFSYSLGLTVSAEGKLARISWDSPAFRAGLAPGMVLVAVNQMAFKPERLKAAISAAQDGKTPIELLLRDGDAYRSQRIAWSGGQRYPRLERIEGTEDRLSALFAPR